MEEDLNQEEIQPKEEVVQDESEPTKRRKLDESSDENEEEEESESPAKTVWEKKCMICKENLFKYRCPRCKILTCSLSCVNKHKKESKCSGQRERTHFIPVSQFTEGDLISDLQFLREAKQASDRIRKQRDVHKK